MVKPVTQSIKDLAALYEQRNAVYGDDYKRHGSIMEQLFPKGIFLKSPSDFNRYAILQNMVTKLNRYAANFPEGGHVDSLDDITVYSQMLQELDRQLIEDQNER